MPNIHKALDLFFKRPQLQPVSAKPEWGISFSRRQCEYLDLDWRDTLEKLAETGFKKVRLSSYWSEIELEQDKYDFSLIKQELDLAAELGMEVLLTVGMKAQRWPEYYFPDYLKELAKQQKVIAAASEVAERVQQLLMVTLPTLKQYTCIKAWQIENEPLDASGPNSQQISPELLQAEIDLVAQLDDRPRVLNAWGNDLKRRRTINKFLKLHNFQQLGFDFYPKQYTLLGYRGPDMTLVEIQRNIDKLRDKGITPIITELQAEPWEQEEGQGGFDYKLFPEKIKSVSLEIIQQNIRDYAAVGFAEIFLWGSEYLVWNGNASSVQHLTEF